MLSQLLVPLQVPTRQMQILQMASRQRQQQPQGRPQKQRRPQRQEQMGLGRLKALTLPSRGASMRWRKRLTSCTMLQQPPRWCAPNFIGRLSSTLDWHLDPQHLPSLTEDDDDI